MTKTVGRMGAILSLACVLILTGCYSSGYPEDPVAEDHRLATKQARHDAMNESSYPDRSHEGRADFEADYAEWQCDRNEECREERHGVTSLGCDDFPTQRSAQAYFEDSGSERLDADGDGIACDHLP